MTTMSMSDGNEKGETKQNKAKEEKTNETAHACFHPFPHLSFNLPTQQIQKYHKPHLNARLIFAQP